MKYLVLSFFINILMISVDAQIRERELNDAEKYYVIKASKSITKEISLFWKTLYKDSVDRPILHKSSFWTNSTCCINHLLDERNILKSSDRLVASRTYTSEASFYVKDIRSSIKKILFLQEDINNNINSFIKTYTNHDFSNCASYGQDTHLINNWFESYKIVNTPLLLPDGVYYDEIIGKNYSLIKFKDPYYNLIYELIFFPSLEGGKPFFIIRFKYQLNYYTKK